MINRYQKLDKALYIAAYLFFLIPASLFFIFWYKWYISIPVLCGLIFIFIRGISRIKLKKEKEYKEIFNIKKWIAVLLLLLGLNILSGTGGLSYQNGDHNARNAVMHDLIEYDWPVKYEYTEEESKIIGFENGYFSYYFAYWLPSAVVGKVFGFKAANLALFIYQFVGLILFYYFLSRFFNKVRVRYFFVFVAFSGLDAIGQILIDKKLFYSTQHIDTWAGAFCFSSNITQLFWVFNQGVSTWLIMSLLFNETNFKNVGIYMLFILLFAPFPAVGYAAMIFILCIFGFYGFNKKNNGFLKNFIELFSAQNIISVIIIGLLAFFLTVNAGSQPKTLFLDHFPEGSITLAFYLKRYILFWVLELGALIAIVISKKNYKWVIAMTIFLSIIPFIYMGYGCDFSNRVSLAMLDVLMILLMEKVNDFKFKNIGSILIIVYLCISCITPLCEINRTLKQNVYNIKNNVTMYSDNWKTYGKIETEDVIIYIHNFSTEYKENKFVFKYILK